MSLPSSSVPASLESNPPSSSIRFCPSSAVNPAFRLGRHQSKHVLNEDKERSTGENVAVRSVENPPMTRNESARILDSCLSLEPRLEQVTEEGEGEDDGSKNGSTGRETGGQER